MKVTYFTHKGSGEDLELKTIEIDVTLLKNTPLKEIDAAILKSMPEGTSFYHFKTGVTLHRTYVGQAMEGREGRYYVKHYDGTESCLNPKYESTTRVIQKDGSLLWSSTLKRGDNSKEGRARY